MSQRINAQSYPSSYDPPNRSSTSHSHQQHGSEATTSPADQRSGHLPPPPPLARNYELPPLLRVPAPSSGSVSPSNPRSVTLPSVLNPTPDEGLRRRKADQLSSPRDSVTTLPPMLGNSQTRISTPTATGSAGPIHNSESTDRPGRKVLTPKSPLRRAISLSHLNPASGSINAQQNPFPVSPHSRPYIIEPGTSGAPPLPTPATHIHQGHYGFPSIVPPPSDLPRMLSPDIQRYSASPSPGGYSPYDENSPSGYSGYDQVGPGYLTINDPLRGASRGMSVPASTTSSGPQLNHVVTSAPGQSTYQMMTLKTTEGDVRFPVDVQAASRVADEKRKRNAGASARFRERRKKKEMEATSTISKLEQQVKEVSEDADFYKKERDVLAGIIRGMNGGELQLSKRPPSPHVRRHASNPSSSTRGISSNAYTAGRESTVASPDADRRVRRRTSSFPMAQAPATIPQPFGQVAQQQSYGTQSQHPEAHQHASATTMLPPASQMSGYSGASGLPPPPPVMQAPPMTGPYNPFASRYDPISRPPQGR